MPLFPAHIPPAPAHEGHAVFKFQEERNDESHFTENKRRESGAHSNRPTSVFRGGVDVGRVGDFIKTAQTQLEDGKYHDAAQTIEHAVTYVEESREHVASLLDDAIDYLSTIHGPAEPPHPAALNLIQKRSSTSL